MNAANKHFPIAPVALAVTATFSTAPLQHANAATIHVTTTTQKVASAGSGGCSLQEAIYSSNFANNIALVPAPNSLITFVTTDCEAGTGDDTIVLAGGETYSMSRIVYDPYNYVGPTATPVIFAKIVIEANGATLVHAANAVRFRLFSIGSGSASRADGTVPGAGSLDIRNANIRGFSVKGGDGASGGGGGLGAGGAIYVNEGSLVVESTAFEANGAFGGNGSPRVLIGSGGGGGGGLGGNGGMTGGPPMPGQGGGTGGGGGGARGIGADATNRFGGGGGGTANDGVAGQGGFLCGGNGGDSSGEEGADGCSGGGGGGGTPEAFLEGAGKGGDGGYGGGGAGGGADADGGKGGFGGGGGSSDSQNGGNGGFGGGGASSFGQPGHALIPTYGGDASQDNSGGGAGLGGAIFNHRGTVRIYNSTFSGNVAQHGCKGGGCDGADTTAQNSGDAGAAIFSLNGALSIFSSTVSGNQGTGAGAGVVAIGAPDFSPFDPPPPSTFELRNTIIAGNNGLQECFWGGESISAEGSGNLIVNNGVDSTACPGVVATADPQLGALQFNVPGVTKTMTIGETSPAYNAGIAYTAAEILSAPTLATDQRGVSRPQFGAFDIGAYEVGCSTLTTPASFVQSTDPNACNAVVTYPLATANGACGTVSCSPVSGSVFPLGPTSVTCSTTTGLTAGFTIGVRDTQVPTIDPISVARPALWPLDHTLVNVGLAGGSASDNCGGSVTTLRVFANEDDATNTGDGVYSPDAANVAVGTLRLRAERLEVGNGRVYLIVAKVTDASNNSAFRVASVVVPKSQSTSSMNAVNALKAAAVSYVLSHDGAPPPGYFVVGDGPIIGPKQ
jgi:hypothetical protein